MPEATPESLFHPAVASWFARRFPDGPTPPQTAAWPHIANGEDVLVASPTGSGKTLTGFPGRHRRRLPGRRHRRPHRRDARGPLHLAPARPGGRRAREPARAALGDSGGGSPPRLSRPRPAHRGAHGRHAARRARRHEEAVARSLGDHARVALSAPHRAVLAGAAARRAHRHRRRGTHPGPRQAGQPSRAEPRASRRAGHRERRPSPAHRPLGHPASARHGGPPA